MIPRRELASIREDIKNKNAKRQIKNMNMTKLLLGSIK